MCGIAGILNFKRPISDEAPIRCMTAKIAHRGPDAEGYYTNDRIALGHRRLSIIDLNESANQPMRDASGRYVIVFNGEMYNYREVKAQLNTYVFRTQSDTEVILAAYAAWGAEGIKRFNGMFALAIWDTQEKELFVARDRLGKKTLYYYLSDDHFVFGSEMRCILSSGLVPKILEPAYLPEYLKYQAPMNEHTLVQGTKQIKAGHYGIIKNGTLNEIPFWGYDDIEPCQDDDASAKKNIKELLLDSVRLRMISDVPIGAFLSGGIDSSLVVACMSELSEAPINTFTVSFNEKEYDESGYAKQIATKYKTNHHRLLIDPKEFLYSLGDILSAMDSPSGDGPNTYLVAKHTRAANIKVALSGLGGDELFAGYNKFLMYYRLMQKNWVLRFPAFARRIFASAILSAGEGHKYNKLAHLIKLHRWDLSTVYPVLRRSYSNVEANRILYHCYPFDEVESKLFSLSEDIAWMGELSKCTVGELETYTRDVLLRDTDQMAMAHALEVRVPFFDYRLVEYVLSLPDHLKYPHTPKQLLVEAMSPRLPPEISQRPKMGFTLPIEHWLKNELADLTAQKLTYLADRNEFNGSEVMKKWNDFKSNHGKVLWPRIWKLVVLSDWLQRNEL